jgi:hypothetical protein
LHIDLVPANHDLGIIDKPGAGHAGIVPADLAAAQHGLGGIEIGDGGDHQPRRGRHLGEEHRAEFAGADQADPYRLAVGFALKQG